MKKGRGLKIGIIGAGSMGEHHARICSQLRGAKLAAVADTDIDRANELGKRFGAKAFKDFTPMLPGVEAIILATPTETHYEIAKKCLQAGKHLLIEKPFAKTAKEAKNLLEIANPTIVGKTKGLILAVGLIERFNPAFQELLRLIRKEKVLGFHLRRFSSFPERITDANVIQDMMIHDLDLLLSLLPKDEIGGIKAQAKKIKSDKFDKASATISFNSGIIARVEADRVFGIKTRKITVTTERNLIEADLLDKKVYVRDLAQPFPSIHFTANYDQLTAELSDFVKAIKNKTKPMVDGEAGYRALKLAEEVEDACS